MPEWFHHRESAAPYFCVVGDPVAHSKSPQIHRAFAAQFDIELVYDRVQVTAGSLADAVREFRQFEGRGMNVTVPLKAEAYALADWRSERAAQAGAVNTLWFDADGRVNADNTDGVGLVRDLVVNHGVRLEDATILLLGAGGAARGVVPALLDASPRCVQISNRTAAKASAIAQQFARSGVIEVVTWGAPGAQSPDLVINATSLSLSGQLPALDRSMLRPETVCYDMMYSSEPTSFMNWVRAQGVIRAMDGLGMLVEQAAEAFHIWHGERPGTAEVIGELRGT